MKINLLASLLACLASDMLWLSSNYLSMLMLSLSLVYHVISVTMFNFLLSRAFFVWKIVKNILLQISYSKLIKTTCQNIFENVCSIRSCLYIIIGVPPDLLNFCRSCNHINLRQSSLWQKICNGWKLLSTVVTKIFALNMTGLLGQALKHIDKFRLRLFHLPIVYLK